MSELGRNALIVEAVVCFGCLAVALLVSAPLLLTYVPLLFSGAFLLLGPLLACYLGGILGLYGLYALLRKILNPHATVASAHTILLCAAAGLSAVIGLAAFTLTVAGSAAARGALIATALPVLGTLHLLYLGRWYLAPGRFAPPQAGARLSGHPPLKSLKHVGLLVAATGALPVVLLYGLVGGLFLLVEDDTVAQIRACPGPGPGVAPVARLELAVPPSGWAALRRSLARVSENEGYEFVDHSTSDPDADVMDARVCDPGTIAELYEMRFTFVPDDEQPGDTVSLDVYPRSPESDGMGFARRLARALADGQAQPVVAQPLGPRGLPLGHPQNDPPTAQ